MQRKHAPHRDHTLLNLRKLDALFLTLVVLCLQIPQLFIHYEIDIPVRAMSSLMLLSLLVFRFGVGVLVEGTIDLSWRFRSLRSAVLWSFLTLMVVASLRAIFNVEGMFGVAFNAILFSSINISLGFLYFGTRASALSWNEKLQYLAFGFLLFILLNFAIYCFDQFRGFESSGTVSKAPNNMLEMVGIQAYRVKLPLSYGINAFGPVAALGLIISIYLAGSNVSQLTRTVAISAAVVAVLTLVLVDSRGSTAGLFAAIIFSRLVKGSMIIVFVMAMLLAPVAIVLGSSYFENATLSKAVSRTSESGDELTSNRDIIWELAVRDLMKLDAGIFFGYGLYGNTATDLMDSYRYIFPENKDSTFEFFSLHNNFLQLIFDVGLVGLLAYVVLLLLSFQELDRIAMSLPHETWLIRTTLVFFMIVGSIEACPSIYFPDCFLMFSLLMIALHHR